MNNIYSTSITDIGSVRTINEDAVLEGEGIYAVADGMGGHNAGEVASGIAISALEEYVAENRHRLPGPKLVKEAVEYANLKIYERSVSGEEFNDMGTTLTALYTAGDGRVSIGSVGDSRAYLFREGGLGLLTHDDSLVEKLVEDGIIGREEAQSHPRRNVILKALGVEPSVEAEIVDEVIEPGDLFLLSTDGLTSMVEDREIKQILAGTRELNKAAKRLVSKALERGGTDNVSVVLILFGVEDTGKDLNSTHKRSKAEGKRAFGLFGRKRRSGAAVWGGRPGARAFTMGAV